ncbi:helix-turn-helix domain-containing protein, partial [Streptomyces sp. SID625]|nr:helix-turn-helix domain-containing protein [Streptomyces sp. SID625]
MPRQLVGALLRHHRTLKGLTYLQARVRTQISATRLRETELAQRRLTGPVVRALLRAYGAAEEDVRAIADLVPAPDTGHQHQADGEILQQGACVQALQAAARTTVFFTTGPLQPVLDVLAAARAAREDRRPYPWQARLLLHEPVLGHVPLQQLERVLAHVGDHMLSVQFVPAEVPAPPGLLLTEWTLTAHDWS